MSSLLGFRGGKMVGMGAGSTLISFVCSSICILRQTHAHSCDSGHILTLCSLCNEKPYFKQLAMYRLHTCTHTHHRIHLSTLPPSPLYPESPSVTITPPSAIVNPSESTTFTCEARGSPRPSIIWTNEETGSLEVSPFLSKEGGQPLSS